MEPLFYLALFYAGERPYGDLGSCEWSARFFRIFVFVWPKSFCITWDLLPLCPLLCVCAFFCCLLCRQGTPLGHPGVVCLPPSFCINYIFLSFREVLRAGMDLFSTFSPRHPFLMCLHVFFVVVYFVVRASPSCHNGVACFLRVSALFNEVLRAGMALFSTFYPSAHSEWVKSPPPRHPFSWFCTFFLFFLLWPGTPSWNLGVACFLRVSALFREVLRAGLVLFSTFFPPVFSGLGKFLPPAPLFFPSLRVGKKWKNIEIVLLEIKSA